LHGSAFYYRDKAYLICAIPGAGKSTLSTAIAKYHEDVSFLTDDIICVKEDGQSMYRGVQKVNLNNDSYNHLCGKSNNGLMTYSTNVLDNQKTTYNLKSQDKLVIDQNIEIGGVFFLYPPIEDSLIKIEKLNKFDFFCEVMKNIKYRKSMVDEILLQEMGIVNNMTNRNIFGVKLQIKHDYSLLQEVTDQIIGYINNQI